jgi:hypothetical protein
MVLQWCWRVLKAVKESCDSVLRELYTPAYLENESQLPWVVGWILMALSGLETGISNRRPIQNAAEAMKAFIETDGSSFISDQVMAKAYKMPVNFVLEDELRT